MNGYRKGENYMGKRSTEAALLKDEEAIRSDWEEAGDAFRVIYGEVPPPTYSLGRFDTDPIIKIRTPEVVRKIGRLINPLIKREKR
jgi:hypothetical protein